MSNTISKNALIPGERLAGGGKGGTVLGNGLNASPDKVRGVAAIGSLGFSALWRFMVAKVGATVDGIASTMILMISTPAGPPSLEGDPCPSIRKI